MTVAQGAASRLGDEELGRLRELAAQLRVDSIRSSTAAGSGHPTSSLSAADLLTVLIFRHLRYDWREPDNPANDHLIFVKGHASPLLYPVFKAVGVVSDEELVNTYRRFGSRLEGHPTPVLPWVDVATGSLGQGLPVGVSVALARPSRFAAAGWCSTLVGAARRCGASPRVGSASRPGPVGGHRS